MKAPKSYHFLSILRTPVTSYVQKSKENQSALTMSPNNQPFHIRLHFRLLLIITVLLIHSGNNSSLANQDITTSTPKKVLIIHSFHKGLSWTDGIEAGIRDNLKETPNIQIFTEYLDSQRYDFTLLKGPFGRYLRNKYFNITLDLIIVSGDNALTFLRNEPVEDFIGVPVIFCGVETLDPDVLQDINAQKTGITITFSPGDTIRIIGQLQPQNRRLVIISDNTPVATRIKKQTEEALASHPQKKEIIWWHNLGRDDLAEKLSTLSQDDAVLLIHFSRDPLGNRYSQEESVRLFTSITKAPVYALQDNYLGTGVVGGRMVSSQKQGEIAAILAKRYFQTGNLQSVIQDSPNENLFDAKALQIHGIEERRLPGDARIIGTPSTSLSRPFIAIAAALLIVMLMLFLLYLMRSLFTFRTRLITFIGHSVLSISSSFIICLLLIIIAGKYSEYQHSISFYYNQLLETKKQTLTLLVEQAVNLINQSKKDIQVPLEQRKQALLKQISAFSFQDKTRYIFVLDYNGTILAHGADPVMTGKDSRKMSSPNGMYPAREIIRLAQQTDGGFISYLWPKPFAKGFAPKITYSKGIQDWQWAIASGIYLDDIDLLLEKEKEKQYQFFLQEFTLYITISVVGILLLFIFSKRLSQKIQRELSSLEKGLLDQNEKSTNLHPRQYKIIEFSTIASRVRAAFSALARANAKLLANKQQFIDALHSSPDAMLLIDKNKLVECNQPAAAMLGYTSPEELLSLHPSQFSPPEQPDGQKSKTKAIEIITRTISQGTNRFEWIHLRKDGTPITIEVTLTLSPVTGTSSDPLLQCVWRDLTLTQELSRQMQQVEEQRKISLEASERMNHLMSGREERIIEIKKEVNLLLKELGRPAKYCRNDSFPPVSRESIRSEDIKE